MNWVGYYFAEDRRRDILDDLADPWLRACRCCAAGRAPFEGMSLRDAWRVADDYDRATFIDSLLDEAIPQRQWIELMYGVVELMSIAPQVLAGPMSNRLYRLRIHANKLESELCRRWNDVMRAAA